MSKANVKLILGSHGSGKSDFIYSRFLNMSRKEDGIVDFDKKFFLIVPEQDTNDKQRLIMHKADELGYGAGILNIDVVSFDRIAHNVFDILGIVQEKENIVDDDVKTMILSLVLDRLHDKGNLKYCNKLVKSVGFAQKLTKAMSEFYAYNVTDEDFEKVIADKESDIYRDKLDDLKTIFNEFKKVLVELNFSIKEDKYDLLNKKILDVDMFNDAIVAFDGFTGFTPVQLEIFTKIASVASNIYVAIDLRTPNNIKQFNINENISKVDVFYLSKKFVKDVAIATGASSIEDLISSDSLIDGVKKYDLSGVEALKYIEKNIYENKNFITETKHSIDVSSIDYYVADNIRDEVLNAVQVIYDLVLNKGYKYKDICIMLPSIDVYRDTIIKTFARYSIPLFIDDTVSVLNSPYVEVIRSALDVLNYNFTYESIMRYFSSGVFRKSKDIFEFDKFIIKHAFRGYNRYKYAFEKITEESALLKVKREYIDPLLKFYENISKTHEISAYLDALKDFIIDIKLDDGIDTFMKEMESSGITTLDLHKTKSVIEYSKDVVRETINSMCVLENYRDKSNIILHEVSIERFRRLFDVGLASKGLKSIPYSLDQVVVGDLMRTRFENPKVELFLGLNQSQIPARTNDNNLIDDKMRELFSKNVKELSQTTIETALNQRFYIYLALTNPSDKLVLSYSKTNVSGETDDKSPVLHMIEKLFSTATKDGYETYLKAKRIDKDNFTFYTDKDLISYVAENMDDIKRSAKIEASSTYEYGLDEDSLLRVIKAKRLLRYLHSNNKLSEAYKRELNQIDRYKDERISSKINEDLLSPRDKDYRGSVTAIESFNSCPYKFFMEKTLKINEIKAYNIHPYDIGNAAHYVFEKLFSEKNIINDSDEKVDASVDRLIDEVFDKEEVFKEFRVDDKSYFGANRTEYIKGRIRKLIHYASNLIIDITKHTMLGVDALEDRFTYNINKNDNTLEELYINGRIDRIDVSDVGGKTYVSVLDYKSGFKSKELDVKDVEAGTNIQLIVYIDYALNYKYAKSGRNPIFTGAFYFWVDDPIINLNLTSANEELEKKKSNSLGLSGIANSDAEVIKKAYGDISIEENAGKIKKAMFNKGYKLASNYMSADELSSLVNTMHMKVNETMKNINDGVVTARPANDLLCKRCMYKNICRKDKLIIDEEDAK